MSTSGVFVIDLFKENLYQNKKERLSVVESYRDGKISIQELNAKWRSLGEEAKRIQEDIQKVTVS